MIYTMRLARLALTVLILMILVFVSCQRPGQSTEGDNPNVQIALQPMPLEETLVVLLTDADGAPMTDATVAVEGNMNHAGMIPVLADPVADDADGDADGHYHLPFTFTMLGDWILSVTVTQADGSSFTRDLEVRSSEEGIEGDRVMPPDVMPLHNDTASHGSTLQIHAPMARAAPLAGGTGAVYFTLHNNSDTTVKFMGADSPAANAVELHTTENDNGIMRMRQIVDGVEIAAGRMIELTPGAMHLMLVNLAAPLAEGETIQVTLHFEGTDDLTIDVPVVSLDALPAEGEMTHDHK